jgi:hypothetical protein
VKQGAHEGCCSTGQQQQPQSTPGSHAGSAALGCYCCQPPPQPPPLLPPQQQHQPYPQHLLQQRLLPLLRQLRRLCQVSLLPLALRRCWLLLILPPCLWWPQCQRQQPSLRRLQLLPLLLPEQRHLLAQVQGVLLLALVLPLAPQLDCFAACWQHPGAVQRLRWLLHQLPSRLSALL